MTLKVNFEKLDKIVTAKRNPKKHSLDAIIASLERFGFTTPILINEYTGKVVAGHGRLAALQKMHDSGARPPNRITIDPVDSDTWYVPTIRVPFKDEKEAEAYLIADNRLVEMGGWDTDLLHSMLKDDLGMGAFGLEWEPPVEAPVSSPAIGPSPEDLEQKYHAAEIKQIVLYFDAVAYEATLGRLAALMQKAGLDNHTDAVLEALSKWEQWWAQG